MTDISASVDWRRDRHCTSTHHGPRHFEKSVHDYDIIADVPNSINIIYVLNLLETRIIRRRTPQELVHHSTPKNAQLFGLDQIETSAQVGFPDDRVVGTSPEGHEEACATTDCQSSRPLLGAGVLNRGSVA